MSPKVPYGKSRDAIARAARRLFHDHGYAAVSMDAIADGAGVSRRTIYNQYEGKEEIFRDVVVREWEELGEAMPRFDIEGDPFEVMRATAAMLLEFLRRPEFVAMTRMMIAESRNFPWLNGSIARESFQPLLDRFVEYLAALNDRGILSCAHPELVTHQLIGGLTHLYFWPLVQGDTIEDLPDPQKAIDVALHMIVCTYCAPLDQSGE